MQVILLALIAGLLVFTVIALSVTGFQVGFTPDLMVMIAIPFVVSCVGASFVYRTAGQWNHNDSDCHLTALLLTGFPTATRVEEWIESSLEQALTDTTPAR